MKRVRGLALIGAVSALLVVSAGAAAEPLLRIEGYKQTLSSIPKDWLGSRDTALEALRKAVYNAVSARKRPLTHGDFDVGSYLGGFSIHSLLGERADSNPNHEWEMFSVHSYRERDQQFGVNRRIKGSRQLVKGSDPLVVAPVGTHSQYGVAPMFIAGVPQKVEAGQSFTIKAEYFKNFYNGRDYYDVPSKPELVPSHDGVYIERQTADGGWHQHYGISATITPRHGEKLTFRANTYWTERGYRNGDGSRNGYYYIRSAPVTVNVP